MNQVYLLLGSNLEDRLELIDKARSLISRRVGAVQSESSVYETEPWGFRTKKKFLNQVVQVDTALAPAGLLETILQIEDALGRKRGPVYRYESRTIDIDILFYNNSVIHLEKLEIPHPRLHERLFALIPMSELAADLVHPEKGRTISELLQQCLDKGKVELYSADLNT